MKRCPECRRDYYDDSLLYCLDDGSELLEGPGSGVGSADEPATAILHEAAPPVEAETRAQVHSGQSAVFQRGTGVEPQRFGRAKEVQRRSPHRVAKPLIAAVAVLAVLVVGFFVYRYYDGADSGQINSIAVLPFQNASGDPELDYLSDGMSESLIDRLSQMPTVKVIARSSSFRYRGDNDPREVAAALNVGAIISGRVMPRGDSVSIRVELIDARENKHLWGENFVRPMSDVQVLQNDISRQIADILRVRLSGQSVGAGTGGGTPNHEAYELFLRGRFYFHRAGAPENFRRAADYLEQAIAIDQNFALAHALLSDAYGFGGFPPGLSRTERESLLERITQRAIELDPNLAEAHNSMATYRRRTWQWEQAKASSLRSIELNPNLAQAVNGYAFHLTLMGQHDAAIENALRARDLDPISLVINTNLGNIYMRMGRYDEAIEVLQKTIDFGEPAMFARRSLGSIYLIRGVYDQALVQYEEAFRISGNSPSMKALIGYLQAKAGRRDLAENIAREIKAGPGAPPELALLLDSLGRRDEAFEVLHESLRDRAPGLPLVTTEPLFRPLANDERFRSLLIGMGLPVEQ